MWFTTFVTPLIKFTIIAKKESTSVTFSSTIIFHKKVLILLLPLLLPFFSTKIRLTVTEWHLTLLNREVNCLCIVRVWLKKVCPIAMTKCEKNVKTRKTHLETCLALFRPTFLLLLFVYLFDFELLRQNSFLIQFIFVEHVFFGFQRELD